jgi:hypothetical protein
VVNSPFFLLVTTFLALVMEEVTGLRNLSIFLTAEGCVVDAENLWEKARALSHQVEEEGHALLRSL